MKTIDMIALIAIVMGVLGYAFYNLAVGTKRKDRPGPQNNWRKNTSTSNSSGWSESGQGSYGDGDGGGVAD